MTPDTPLPDWFDQIPLAYYLIPFAGIVALVLLGAMWVKYVNPYAVKISHFVDDFFGEEARPGVERVPGVLERLEQVTLMLTASKQTLETHTEELEELKSELQTVKAQVTPNHGSSAHDTLMKEIRRGNTIVEALAVAIAGLKSGLEESQEDRKKIWEKIDELQESE